MGLMSQIKGFLVPSSYENEQEEELEVEYEEETTDNLPNGGQKTIINHVDDYMEEDEEITEEKPRSYVNFNNVNSNSTNTTATSGYNYREEVKRMSDSMDYASKLKVIMFKPLSVEEVKEIANQLNNNNTVVLNLEKTDVQVSRSILEFLSGAAYITGGQVNRISEHTYIITPENVSMHGESIDEFDVNAIYES